MGCHVIFVQGLFGCQSAALEFHFRKQHIRNIRGTVLACYRYITFVSVLCSSTFTLQDVHCCRNVVIFSFSYTCLSAYLGAIGMFFSSVSNLAALVTSFSSPEAVYQMIVCRNKPYGPQGLLCLHAGTQGCRRILGDVPRRSLQFLNPAEALMDQKNAICMHIFDAHRTSHPSLAWCCLRNPQCRDGYRCVSFFVVSQNGTSSILFSGQTHMHGCSRALGATCEPYQKTAFLESSCTSPSPPVCVRKPYILISTHSDRGIVPSRS